MLHFVGQIIESQSSNEEDEFHDSVEDVDGLANIFEETSLKDKYMRLKKADKNLRRINELVEKVTVIPEENVKANLGLFYTVYCLACFPEPTYLIVQIAKTWIIKSL